MIPKKRLSSSGRNLLGDYFCLKGLVDRDDQDDVDYYVSQINELLQQQGFESIFDVTLCWACGTNTIGVKKRFLLSGQLQQFIELFNAKAMRKP